jgi:hypothetical protein
MSIYLFIYFVIKLVEQNALKNFEKCKYLIPLPFIFNRLKIFVFLSSISWSNDFKRLFNKVMINYPSKKKIKRALLRIVLYNQPNK